MACQDPIRPPAPRLAYHGQLRRNVQFAPHCASQFPQKPNTSPYGVVAHILAGGVQPWNPTTDTTYGTVNTLLGQANVGWIRVDFDWGRVIGTSLDTNQLNWAPMDAAMNRAVCSGLNVLGGLAYTPGVASTRPGLVDSMRFAYMPDSVRYWAAFVRAAVNHYPQVRYWSIWNEPNTTSWFRGYAGETDVVPAYEALLDAAAPGIRQNVDAQGRRYLVGPELAGGLNDSSDQWLRRVLVDRGSLIDVVAVHHYSDTSGTGVRNYVSGLPNRLALPSWPWPIWLTESGVTGCNATDKNKRRNPSSYCTGPYRAYISDAFQSQFVGSVLSAMQAAGGAPWAKTFIYDGTSEVARDSVGEAYGLFSGVRTNSLVARPAYTTLASTAGPLTITGSAQYVSTPQNVTVTATRNVPGTGSYYVVWELMYCYHSTTNQGCDNKWYPYTSGSASGPTYTVGYQVYPQTAYAYLRLHLYAWQGGPLIGWNQWNIYGPG